MLLPIQVPFYGSVEIIEEVVDFWLPVTYKLFYFNQVEVQIGTREVA